MCTRPSFLYLNLMFESRSVCLKQNKAKDSADVSQDSFSETSQEQSKAAENTSYEASYWFQKKMSHNPGLVFGKVSVKAS